MKKILALALALIMLLSVAALVHADEGVTITYMASQDWVQDAEMELAEKFTEKTGIKVDFQIIPSDQYTTLLMSKLNAGECADLFGSQAGQFDILPPAADTDGLSIVCNYISGYIPRPFPCNCNIISTSV